MEIYYKKIPTTEITEENESPDWKGAAKFYIHVKKERETFSDI